ncbi:MAG: hypothetical protein R3335_04225 [Anaerolineales bacterium]|nr:hypothetical protein [Anaerolineales bacterium]
MKISKKKLIQFLLGLTAVVSLLVTAQTANAELKATSVVYAWDFNRSQFRNSNVDIPFDSSWVEFIHQIGFDNDLWPDACGPGTSTQWAGEMEFGLYSLDNNPPNEIGFQATRAWQLIDCDLDGDGDFDNNDRNVDPSTPGAIKLYQALTPSSQDQTNPCSTGNCAEEIVTTLFINTDSDCNGTQNTDIPAAGLCFYAEAQVPPAGSNWGNPLQARITAGGGDKTVSFNQQPTAIVLKQLQARSGDKYSGLILAASTALFLFSTSALIYTRRKVAGTA